MREIKVGQKYKPTGWWVGSSLPEHVKITAVHEESDTVCYVPGIYGATGADGAGISTWEERWILIEDVPQVVSEVNQLSPNVYQFPNGVEVKDISAHLTSFGGQAVQYIARATRLDGVVKGLPVQDLYKAIELLKWEAERLEALQK